MYFKRILTVAVCSFLTVMAPCTAMADSNQEQPHAVTHSVETVIATPLARSGPTIIYTSNVSGNYGFISGVTVSGSVSGRYSSGSGTVTALYKETTSFKLNSGTTSTHSTKSSGSAVASFSWSEYDGNPVKSTTTVTVCKKSGWTDQTLVNFTSYADVWG